MTAKSSRFDRILAFMVAGGWLALAVAGVSPSFGQAPADCPANGVCNGTYALCIAASCDPNSGVCGVMQSGSDWVPCDQAGLDAGTCGPCYVLTGQSCSYYEACAELPSDGLTSTYSEALLEGYGFQWKTCTSGVQGFDCMDGACTATGQTVTVDGQQLATATCNCKPAGDKGHMQVNACGTVDCSASWSTAGLECASGAQCCSGSCTNGHCG